MSDSSADLIETHEQNREQGGNTTVCLPELLETKMVNSTGDLIAGNTPSCTTPSTMEMKLVDSSVDLVAEQRQGLGQGDKTILSISRAMETEIVGSSAGLTVKRKQVLGKGGKRTSCTPRAMENKMANTRTQSIAKHRRVRGRGVNTTLYTSTVMETEMAQSSINLIARHGQGHGQGRNTSLCSARVMETELMESGVGNTTLYPPRAMEAEMMQSGGNLIARTVQGNGLHGRGHIQGGRGGRRGTKRGMQGTWSHPTQKRERKRKQNKEISNPRLSSRMEKGPSSPEGQAANIESGSSSPETVRPCKKTILSWLIDCKTIKEDEQVYYMDDIRKRALTGRITSGGIFCSCCHEETSVWTFEKHAGSDMKQPYKHIYLGRKCKSLRNCQVDAWQLAREQKRRRMFSYVPKETAADQNDDACPVCGIGGDLICCDKCPSTYHLSCLNIERVPQNDWFCPYCVCEYCGLVVDLVVEKKEWLQKKEGSEKKEGFKCSQCDKKCHWKCFEEFEKETRDLNPSRSYCGPTCREIYEKLEVSLGIKNDYSTKYSWRVIRRMDKSKTPDKVSADINLYLENNSKVAVTWMLMNEAFETTIDLHTGINVVQSVVYSCRSNLTRIDFSQFYMFVLEEDDEIIAAASIRFHGRGIAEMPFIATEMAHRGQGVCQELMRVIESFLCNLKVTKLIIPSARETSDMWKRKFNFTEVSEELEREISSYKILMFSCALRLYKDLTPSIADSGNDIKEDKTDIKNDLEPQTEQATATARLEHGPSSKSSMEV